MHFTYNVTAFCGIFLELYNILCIYIFFLKLLTLFYCHKLLLTLFVFALFYVQGICLNAYMYIYIYIYVIYIYITYIYIYIYIYTVYIYIYTYIIPVHCTVYYIIYI